MAISYERSFVAHYINGTSESVAYSCGIQHHRKEYMEVLIALFMLCFCWFWARVCSRWATVLSWGDFRPSDDDYRWNDFMMLKVRWCHMANAMKGWSRRWIILRLVSCPMLLTLLQKPHSYNRLQLFAEESLSRSKSPTPFVSTCSYFLILRRSKPASDMTGSKVTQPVGTNSFPHSLSNLSLSLKTGWSKLVPIHY